MKKITFIFITLFCFSTIINAQVKDDGKKAGFVYFEDNFDWIKADWGTSDYIGGDYEGNEVRMDLVAADYKPILMASGWKTSLRFTYLRLGYIKMSRLKDGSDIISPKLKPFSNKEFPMLPNRAGIEEGKTVNITVSFDAAVYRGVRGNRDLDNIVVEVLDAGTFDGKEETEMPLKIGSWNKWKNLSVTIYGATSETQIRIRAANIVTEKKPTRFFIDNFKVEKAK